MRNKRKFAVDLGKTRCIGNGKYKQIVTKGDGMAWAAMVPAVTIRHINGLKVSAG